MQEGHFLQQTLKIASKEKLALKQFFVIFKFYFSTFLLLTKYYFFQGNIYFLKKDKIRGFPGLNRPMLGGFPQNFRSKWLKCKQASIPHKLRLAKKSK